MSNQNLSNQHLLNQDLSNPNLLEAELSVEKQPNGPIARNSDLKINTRRTNPRLKSGVRFWRSDLSRQLHIGTRFSNFLLPDRIGDLEIESTLNQLSKGSGSGRAELQVLCSILENLSLIDDEYTEINYQYRSEENRDIAASIRRSVAQESFLRRIRIESDGISRSPEVRDGGIRKILQRREFAIRINGSGRIAFALLGALIASGFDLCEIDDEVKVNSKDVIGGCIGKRDIGMAGTLKLDDLTMDASLYPEPRQISKQPDLMIAIGSPLPELLEDWNRRRIPQLFIDFDHSGEIRIGPYVEPGNGACYNCVNIAEIELGRPLVSALRSALGHDQSKSSASANELDVTAALATFAAGTLALAIAEIADSRTSQFHEKTALFSTLQFLEPQITSWERSPRCSCNWI